MNRCLWIALACGALAATAATAGTLYKSVGPDGRIVYSDQPPQQGRLLMSRDFEAGPSTSLPQAALEQLHRLKNLKTAARPSAGLILYSASWCTYCEKAKAYLYAKGKAFQEVDIDTPEGLAAFAQAGGGKGVPLLVAGDRRVQGFSAARYDALFAGPK